MRRVKFHTRGFALYEVLLGLTIFVVGVVALGRSVQNCIDASMLSEEENRIRQILSNRMAEIQTKPGVPNPTHQTKVKTSHGEVKVIEKSGPAGLKNDKDSDLNGITQVTLTAKWTRRGVDQSKQIMFYVYRGG